MHRRAADVACAGRVGVAWASRDGRSEYRARTGSDVAAGSRPAAGRQWRGRMASRAWPARSASGCAPGRSPTSAPGGSCPGSPSPSASGSSSTSPPTASRSRGRRPRCSSPPSRRVILARNRPIAFPLALALAAAAAGFLDRDRQARPHRASGAAGGRLERRRRRLRRGARGTRALRPHRRSRPPHLAARGSTSRPSACGSRSARARRRRSAAFVEFKARLSPPLEPLRPGGYDFARNLYFQGIGASGFVLGASAPRRRRCAGAAAARGGDHRRHARRARPAHPLGRSPATAARSRRRCITGKRDAISTPVNDAMFISGLGHVLSISGYHMAVVAGVVFFVLRALFALMPACGRPFPDQEMGGGRRRLRPRRSIWCCRAPRSRRSAPSS